MRDHAEQVPRIGLQGIGFQDPSINLLRSRQATLAVIRQGLLEGLRDRVHSSSGSFWYHAIRHARIVSPPELASG
jgi:hypothetical protein